MSSETDFELSVQRVEQDSESVSLSLIKAEVDVQIATAKKYPRSLAMVKRKMTEFATLDEETAQSCFYSVPRGGKNIQGPSVRLAEIAVSCYGNLRVGARVINVETSGENPHVVVQAVAHDLESNVSICIEKRRRIVGKKKNNGRIDEDDINLACNACTAIAFRDASFKVIPGAIVKPVFDRAKQVAIGDATTLAARRAKAIEHWQKMGIDKVRLFACLEVANEEEIGLDHLENLLGMYTAIRDGQTTLDEAFPLPGQQYKSRTEAVEAAMREKKSAAEKPAAKSEPAMAAPESPPDPSKVPDAGKRPAWFRDYTKQLHATTTKRAAAEMFAVWQGKAGDDDPMIEVMAAAMAKHQQGLAS